MKELEQYFKALGDNNRLRIINLLLHGELCVCDIQYVLENSQPNVSRHLAYLKNSGMVLDRRDGYRIYYRLTDPGGARPSDCSLIFSVKLSETKNSCSGTQNTLKDAIAAGSARSANGNHIPHWQAQNVDLLRAREPRFDLVAVARCNHARTLQRTVSVHGQFRPLNHGRSHSEA